MFSANESLVVQCNIPSHYLFMNHKKLSAPSVAKKAGVLALSAITAGLMPFQSSVSAEWGGVGGMSVPEVPPVPNPSSTDLDGDGIPNTWEDANFLNKSNAADALSDFDLDGITALQEYELFQQTSGLFGKNIGKWTATTVPLVTGFTTTTPTTTLIECANNGVILARVQGVLSGTGVTTSYPYT